MANILNTDKQISIIAALAEGSSIRSIERITGVHRDTIMRLGVKVGQACTNLMDETMRGLPCTRLELDEICGFFGKKEKHVKPEDPAEIGSVWTFCAIDAETKLVPAFRVGERDAATANAFLADVAGRMTNRVQNSTDGHAAYKEAIERSFGGDADYGHPKANTAYAWSHATDDPDVPKRSVTVLHIPPAVSPLTAVRAVILQELRNADIEAEA